jgi:hypothetical protein
MKTLPAEDSPAPCQPNEGSDDRTEEDCDAENVHTNKATSPAKVAPVIDPEEDE